MELDELLKQQQILKIPSQFIAIYYQNDKISCVSIDLKDDEAIGVSFDKGYVVVRTQYETKFVCKGKDFVCLWR